LKPEFVLLVGAPNFLPFPQVNGTYTDNYYTNMDGDIYNEVLSGRLPVHDNTEAQTVVNKMLLYERTPDTLDAVWLRKGCGIANVEWDNYSDSIYFENVHYYASLMMLNEYLHYDTLSNYFGDDRTDVINSVNNGCGFVLYRGSATNNWYWPFDCNPALTTNGARLPIVLSITCLTLATGPTPTAAEKWFITGTPTTPRGASGYFATTTGLMGGAHLRSAVAKGFADAVFVLHEKTFGEACENGRLRVYSIYGDLEEYFGFTTVGDPEMNLRTARPITLTVVHDTLLYSGVEETLQVSVAYNGSPCESACVCIVYDTLIYDVAYTNSGGTAMFAVNAPYAGPMDITVTGRNLYPYEGNVDFIEYWIDESNNVACNSGGLKIFQNPFKEVLEVGLQVPQGQRWSMSIYDARGRLVKQWNNLNSQEINRISWNAKDENERPVPAGVYFIRFITAGPQNPVPLITTAKAVLLE
jgi:hypothetical protein